MAIKVKYNGSSLDSGLNRMASKLGAVILMFASTKASLIQSQMKTERPWTDRTGMAKALLSARVSRPNLTTVRITLAHGVDYGIWLELANNKNYAVLQPTIEKEAPGIVKDLGDIMSKLK